MLVYFPFISENFAPKLSKSLHPNAPPTTDHPLHEPPSTGDHADPASGNLRSGFHPKILLAISIFPRPTPATNSVNHCRPRPRRPTRAGRRSRISLLSVSLAESLSLPIAGCPSRRISLSIAGCLSRWISLSLSLSLSLVAFWVCATLGSEVGGFVNL
jgi:hypothetical protein